MVDFQPNIGYYVAMIQRNLTPILLNALADTPVVVLHGARQTGKSTLVQTLIADQHPARYLTLDDLTVLAAAQNDPIGFLAGLSDAGENIALDEVQRAPELFLAMKAEVDRNRRPGRFLLTGSANALFIPRLAEALAGRAEIFTLYPLAQDELAGLRGGLIDALFAPDLPLLKTVALDRTQLWTQILTGGYPEVIQRANASRRYAWFNAYIQTILQRDIRDMANIEGLTQLPRLLSLLATRATSLLNVADLARSLDMPQTTLKRYLALLDATFLTQMTPAWASNLGKRLVKAAKLNLVDTGLLAYLLGVDLERLQAEPHWTGMLLENFVNMELRKQATWSYTQPQLFHFRTQTGHEVDIVLEDRRGRIVGIEVKASATVHAQDFKGLKLLADEIANQFIRGIVLYTGAEVIPFGKNLWALPITSLWQFG